jgi:hypothetical protein
MQMTIHTSRQYERIPVGEYDAVQRMNEITKEMLRHDRKYVLRGAHAKCHAIVAGEFHVAPDLPKELRAGLFRTPGTYHALVRFSNGSATCEPDGKRDVRGLAIKVLNVPDAPLVNDGSGGKIQDFVMINHPVFAFPTAKEYVRFFEGMRWAGDSRLGRLVAQACYFITRPRQFFVAFAMISHELTNPLSSPYWSMSPYLWGHGPAKFAVRPSRSVGDACFTSGPDFLRAALIADLQQRDVSFEFLVQLWRSERETPVEDPTREWPESASPFRKVATLRILRQVIDIDASDDLCRRTGFNPWHCAAELRPLGGINRLRRSVYRASRTLRDELNGIDALRRRLM